MEDKSFRVIWEIDVDAQDARSAAELARKSVVDNVAPVYEVHQWDEPDMITATPVAMIDLLDPEADLPAPDKRTFNQYLGPTVI
jgi:hypothetical protein